MSGLINMPIRSASSTCSRTPARCIRRSAPSSKRPIARSGRRRRTAWARSRAAAPASARPAGGARQAGPPDVPRLRGGQRQRRLAGRRRRRGVEAGEAAARTRDDHRSPRVTVHGKSDGVSISNRSAHAKDTWSHGHGPHRGGLGGARGRAGRRQTHADRWRGDRVRRLGRRHALSQRPAADAGDPRRPREGHAGRLRQHPGAVRACSSRFRTC